MADERAEAIVRDFDSLVNARGNFEAQWEEVAERVIPTSSQLFFSRGEQTSPGQKKTEKQLDGRAAVAHERYTAILNALLTPQSQKWHGLKASRPELNRIPAVARWFAEATERLFAYRYSAKANFAAQQLDSYGSVGSFGTGVIFTDSAGPTPQDRAGGLRYRLSHLSNTYLRENHQGAIDSCLRRVILTARQVKQMVDARKLDRMPPSAEKAIDKTPDQPFKFVHCVQPNGEYDGGRLDWRGMPWEGHYVSLEDRIVVGEGGYTTFPFSVGRASTAPGEIYGTSPAMRVLPNIKVLNAQKATNLKMAHRLADPVLLTYDDGIVDGFSLKPGAINAGGVSRQGQKLVQRLDDNVGQIPFVKDAQDDERRIIDDAFLVTLFQILIETGEMTATEVIQRTREKGILLSPMGRFQAEMHGALIERELDLLVRARLLPPLPRELVEAEGDYRVEFDSPLNRAMKAEELGGFTQWFDMAVQAAAITKDPSALDWADVDTAMPESAAMLAVPPRWVRTPEAVEAIRQGRAQAAQTQQLIEAAPAAAAAMKGVAALQRGARRGA